MATCFLHHLHVGSVPNRFRASSEPVPNLPKLVLKGLRQGRFVLGMFVSSFPNRSEPERVPNRIRTGNQFRTGSEPVPNSPGLMPPRPGLGPPLEAVRELVRNRLGIGSEHLFGTGSEPVRNRFRTGSELVWNRVGSEVFDLGDGLVTSPIQIGFAASLYCPHGAERP